MRKWLLAALFLLSSQAFSANFVHWHGSTGPQFRSFENFDQANEYFYSMVNSNYAAVLIDDQGVDVRTFGELYWRNVMMGQAIANGHLEFSTPQRFYVVRQTPWGMEVEMATDSEKAAIDAFNHSTNQFAKAMIADRKIVKTYGIHPEYYYAAIGAWYYQYKL